MTVEGSAMKQASGHFGAELGVVWPSAEATFRLMLGG